MKYNTFNSFRDNRKQSNIIENNGNDDVLNDVEKLKDIIDDNIANENLNLHSNKIVKRGVIKNENDESINSNAQDANGNNNNNDNIQDTDNANNSDNTQQNAINNENNAVDSNQEIQFVAPYIIQDDDAEIIANYRGEELGPEWEWVKDISIVYTWVDGSDVDFLDLKSKYNGGVRKANSRDRSADELRYSLRSLEKYLPWHRGDIFLCTSQQIPKWMDTSNSRIKLIYHKDIFPEHVYPTYDSNTIELFLDKIPGITERFIYFNDDLFLNNYVHPSFFFTSDNFYPKVYRRHITKISREQVDRVIKDNDLHDIFQASKYFTRKIIREYFDRRFKFRDLYHTGHVFYRDLFEPYRQLFKEELKRVCSDRLRNPYKLQVIYLYQTFMQYATLHDEFPKKIGGNGKARLFEGYEFPTNLNRTITKYSCKVIQTTANDRFMKYGRITDDFKRNERYFKLYKTHPNLIIYNFNDAYTKNKSLYQFTNYMITRYPVPSSFEKKEYVDLEVALYPEFNKVNKISHKITSSLPEDYNKGNIARFRDVIRHHRLKEISLYLRDKYALAGPQKVISKREQEEIDFLLKYNGGDLEKEWTWAKDISFVYILENDNENINISEEVEKLKYSLRSIEKFLPWHTGNIYIITQKEAEDELSWINYSNKQLKVINQSEIIPNMISGLKNKHVIEMYLDLIPGISERFVHLTCNHFFINYTHPRFFFSKEYYPKYNYKYALSSNELEIARVEDKSFVYTYLVITDYFSKTYVTSHRYYENAPFPLYRDFFEPIRYLYRKYVRRTVKHITYADDDLLPLYLVSTYNIYGTDQPYFPEYVAGYGRIRISDPPILNEKRTINYYGFDITSSNISKNTTEYDIPLNSFTKGNEMLIKEIQKSKKLFFSLEEKKNKITMENTSDNLELNNIPQKNNWKN
ncbi:hypothetical protein BCR36DRAFT_400298 [Piromyces finnis]|uniref:Stealth protein CR2 conserved region 2 domain-containing protein n=1 Tax=Piromyces finnis TaxID=1754191 RepID=A0A1Y1UWS3_9FUNG|nr:hypothetical protein BCR36DRAFT_400298 [Piromyces finnis]|eukprot:ORX42457.1 hypothetical protein BCR36DRAFT_400298 [Piromyces finnis]